MRKELERKEKELEVFRGWKDTRLTKLESTIARVEKEKSDMEKTLAMLQVHNFKTVCYDLILKKWRKNLP